MQLCHMRSNFYFLADRTNGRAYITVLHPSVVVCLSSVTLCIVAKRCVLEQNLPLRAYRKSLLTGLLTGCGCTWYHHPDLQTFTINPTLSCSHRTCRHSVFKEVHLTFSSDI